MEQPYINQNGDLIIPNQCDPKFQWWNGTVEDRMTLEQILDFVGADQPTRDRYLSPAKPDESKPDKKKAADNKGPE